MEMKFREAGHLRQFIEFDVAIEIHAKMVDDSINSLRIFAVRLDFPVWHGFYRHVVLLVFCPWNIRIPTSVDIVPSTLGDSHDSLSSAACSCPGSFAVAHAVGCFRTVARLPQSGNAPHG